MPSWVVAHVTDMYCTAEQAVWHNVHGRFKPVVNEPAGHVWQVRSLVGVGSSTGSCPGMQFVVLVQTGGMCEAGSQGPARYWYARLQLDGVSHIAHVLSCVVLPVQPLPMYVPAGQVVHAAQTVSCVALQNAAMS